MKKIILTENNLIKLVNLIIEKVDEELEEVLLSPDQFLNLLLRVNYNYKTLKKLNRFKDKKFVINAGLNLSNKPIKDLFDIKINGRLDISGTKISTLENVSFTSLSYYNTPMAEIERKKILKRKFEEQESRREDDEWNIDDTDTEGEMANAVLRYVVDDGIADEVDQEEVQRIKQEINSLNEQKENLETEQKNTESEENWDELQNSIDEIESQLEDLESELEEQYENKVDVYSFYPSGSHYDMNSFECLENGQTFAVGDQDQADESLRSYYENMVDDLGSYFSPQTLENYIDGESLAEYLEESFRQSVDDDPDMYDIPRNLSKSQEKEIWLLEMEKWVYENEGVRAPIQYPTIKEGNVFDFEDSEGNNFQYVNTSKNPNTSNWVLYKEGQVIPPHQIYDDENTEEHDDDRESRISDIDYEIEEIKDNPDGLYDDEEIESKVEDMKYEVTRDPMSFIRDYGLDIENWVNTSELIDDMISNSDYSEISVYDGSYNLIDINGNNYIVFRID